MIFAVIFFAIGVVAIIVALTVKIGIPRRAGFLGLDPPRVVRAYDFMSRMPPFKIIRTMVARTLSKKGNKGSLVDVGCGPGYLLSVIAQKNPSIHLIGVDISKEILAKASENLLSIAGERFELMEGDSEYLPLGNDSVDYVVSTLSLHHWPLPGKAFSEFYRVLKPGGTLVIFDLKRDAIFLFYFLIRFVTAVIVPRALREVKEPLGSLSSSYTPRETRQFMENIRWSSLKLKPGLGWMSVLAVK